MAGIDTEDTIRAAAALRSFDRPVLIIWAPEDRFFKGGASPSAWRPHPGRADRADRRQLRVHADRSGRAHRDLILDLVRWTPAASETAQRAGGGTYRATAARSPRD